MRIRFNHSMIVLGLTTIALAGLVPSVVSPTAVHGQAGAYRSPRLPGTQHPDLNGVWQALTSANWDILDHEAQAGPYSELLGAYGVQPGDRGIVEGNHIPYRPAALAQKQANVDRRLKITLPDVNETGDPESKCYLPGVPRAMYMPYPFHIVQTGNEILMAFAFANATRVIHLKDPGEAPVEFWMGWSTGAWEGETLVVDSKSFNGLTWFDRAGNFAGPNLHVVERLTRSGRDHLQYEATIEDPDTFTKPWKVSFPLYRRIEKHAQISPITCQEFTAEYLWGTLRKKTGH